MENFYIRLFYFFWGIFILITIYHYDVTKKTLKYYPKKELPEYSNLNFIYQDPLRKKMFKTMTEEVISQFSEELIVVAGELRIINDPGFFKPLKNRLIKASEKNEIITLKIIVYRDSYKNKIKELKMKGVDIKVYKSLIYPRIHFVVVDKRHVYIQEIHKPGKITGEYFQKDSDELAKKLAKRFNDFISEDFCEEVIL